MRNFIINYANILYSIALFFCGIACVVVDVEPGVHDLTPFIIFAALGFVSIFYLKPEHFRIGGAHGSHR